MSPVVTFGSRRSSPKERFMPFVSGAQQRFLHAHPEKVGGEGKLAEWDRATDFKNLPERKRKAPGFGRKKENSNG
jgi:hypothetical protein